ncbi:hypothetical protein MSAN_00282000 [Mycena sanguinolenta]|uniref:Uncharacterized protein n=1 Tax=Mycena sanguinolenta TaxID=230812 RepID=A0A8H6ZD02_9AGAR|nr:hypothetical protein MSAN_00282000 [Mycena sanguinolenta]
MLIEPSESESEPESPENESFDSGGEDISVAELVFSQSPQYIAPPPASSQESTSPIKPPMEVDIEDGGASDSDSESQSHSGGDAFNSLAPEPDEDFEVDVWRQFDEELDIDQPLSREDMVRELEEMLAPDQEAELWAIRSEDYEITDDVWAEIWAETAAAMRHIPADFVRLLSDNHGYFTAEAWCFWIVYMAPILLAGRFRDEKYYLHACQFSDIVKTCISFQLTYVEIDELEANIIDWVRKYEDYYYQYEEDRLSACPLTIHGLLHVPDDIRFCGPSWGTWTFWIERFCGYLQASLRSRRHPWANLNNHVLQLAYLEQLGARYDLTDELSRFNQPDKSKLSESEKMYDDYPDVILRAPYKATHNPNDITRARIAGYISAVIHKKRNIIKKKLPENMPRWGRMRIAGDGDRIRSVSATSAKHDETERDMTYVRYELNVRQDDSWIPRIFYGQLQEILVCQLPKDDFWSEMSGRTRLLAVITPCTTFGKDASKERACCTQTTSPIVVDLRTIVAGVGRIQTRRQWYIVDRSQGLLHPTFRTP